MKLGLVLGGGGLIGLGYHAGALKALEERGVDAGRADVIVGTSAGSIVAAYLAIGWRTGEFYDFTHGRHPAAHDEDGTGSVFTPLWQSHHERFRRSIGALVAMASSRGLLRAAGSLPLEPLWRAFPAGLYSTEETRKRLCRDLPSEWPRRGVVLCAAELRTGRRVAFGAPNAPPASFPDAVLASIAIPGIFPAVDINGRPYVDGGVVSGTSLDLAAEAGCDAILCIAPLGYRKDVDLPVHDPRKWSPVLVRAPFARILKREVLAARAIGVDVFVVRPWLSELAYHGTNSMREHDRIALAEGARVGTLRLLDDNVDHPVMRAFTGSASIKRRGEATGSIRSHRRA
jgi:NTE family protein